MLRDFILFNTTVLFMASPLLLGHYTDWKKKRKRR